MFLLYVAVRNQNYKRAETIALPSIEVIFKNIAVQLNALTITR